ncbi:MAG: type VI secretion system ATPase TssH [Desulfobacteraceae bacterium]|nr:type VI secretion system ATPase TssH [Desulfobacteraceae bacterium]
MISVDLKQLLEKLNPQCKKALEKAAGKCVSRTHYEITTDHFFMEMLEDRQSDLYLILEKYGIEIPSVHAALNKNLEELATGNGGRPVFSPNLIELFQDCVVTSVVELDSILIRSGAVIISLLKRPLNYTVDSLYNTIGIINKEDLVRNFHSIVKGSSENPIPVEKGSKAAPPKIPAAQTSLGKFCEDFTKKATDGKIDPVFGRDKEIRQMIDIFARRQKNNPIVVGEAGVGKTAVVEGLALRIIKQDVPDFLKDVRLLGLDMGLLQAGAGVKGEFENRLKNVISEVKASPVPIILFIDEVHTIIGAGNAQGGGDAANLLKPALARGELRTVAATTWSEYKKYFEKDAALARRFQLVQLDEPSVQTSTLILRGLKTRYEKNHGVIIRDDAVVAAAEFADRYISGRYLPDKAIDLLDTSAARVKVLLTAKPSSVEDLERSIQALERELSAIKRDASHGINTDQERMDSIDLLISIKKEELKIVSEQWEKEKELSAKLMEKREQYHGKLSLKPDEKTRTDDKTGHDPEIVAPEKIDQKTINQDIINPDTITLDALAEPNEKPGEIPDEISDEKPEDRLKAEIEGIMEELELVQKDNPLIKTQVDPEIIAKVVADWTGIPVGNVVNDEAAGIINLEDDIKKTIKGQDEAVGSICKIIKASKAGLNEPNQPMGIFLLTGPSGVGKTQTALAMADLLFGGERFSVSINMSEFQEKHTVSRLIGSPPGYVGYGEGGVLTEAVRKRPYSVVILDEAEKANQDVMNLFYQVFDKGELSDGEGRVIDFKNTLIFLTSNLASDMLTQISQEHKDLTFEEIIEQIRPVLSHHFKPALLARMSIVPFKALDGEILEKIVKIKLAGLADRMQTSHKVTLTFSQELITKLAQRCTEVETGARNIDHIMNGSILPMMSQQILEMMAKENMPEAMMLAVDEDGLFILLWDDEIMEFENKSLALQTQKN